MIEYINQLIERGEAAAARAALGKWSGNGLSREERYRLACTARRAGLPYLTLRLLAPLVRPPPKRMVRALEKEKAEYAAALVRVGASREAQGMLRAIDPKGEPQVLLYLAHALFTQWDYESAIPLLESFVGSALSDYQHAVGKVNLASAFVHERRFGLAERALGELEDETRRGGWMALYGNTLERQAELSIQKGDWAKAEASLKKAEQAVEKAGGFDVFFVRKWRAVLHLFQKPKAALGELRRFQIEARERGHWETVRECDAFRAVVGRDRSLLFRVYFGTPFSCYRARLLRDYGAAIAPGDRFVWALEPKGRGKRTWDPFEEPRGLKVSQLKHRLLRTLLSDFYRPFRVAHLFSEVYPEEHFHLTHSRARIHVGIGELRRWLRAKRLPLAIVERYGEYRMAGTRPGVALALRSPAWWEENSLPGVSQIRQRSAGREFSAADVTLWLKCPRRTAFEAIRGGLKAGLFVKNGSGPKTRYRLADRSGKKS